MQELETEYLSKEAIKSRMFRNAARFWGYSDADMDAFDPLVRLMIEACAVESYKINNDIISSDVRVMEKLASLLTPDIFTSALPSHSVIHCRSVEAVSIVDHNFHLLHQKKVASKSNGPLDSNLDIYFTPSGHYKIFDGEVAAIATGNSIYKINNYLEREFVAKSSRSIENNTAWIGVQLSNQINTLDGLTFFFDFKNHPGKTELLSILSYAKWSYNGSPVSIRSGIRNLEEISHDNVLDEFEITYKVKEKINTIYHNCFVTIDDDKNLLERNQFKKSNYPEAFKQTFNESDLLAMNQPLVWFKITFPAAFNAEALDEMVVLLNCFPIMNLRFNELRYRLQNYFNIVLLECDEQFFAIRRVSGTDDIDYISKPASENLTDLNGTYSLRSKGIQRFDARNATEHLNYVLELLRDESSAFAAFGQDFIGSTIKELNQNISLIEQRIKQNQREIYNLPSYLFVRPREEGENINVEFWSTNGSNGNNIRPGSKIDVYRGFPVNSESLQLMLHTSGGINKLNQTEELNAYRSALLSRNRLVTNEDIRSYCFYVLGDKIKEVGIKKGVAISSKPTEGLISTLDITLEPSTEQQFSDEEWSSIAQDLKTQLEKNSVAYFNFRVFIQQPQNS